MPIGEETRPSAGAASAKLATVILPIIAGLAASAMLAVDYIRPSPIFCEEGGGCDLVKHTTLAQFLGLPTPLYGLAGFLALGVLALVSAPWARGAMLAIASIGTGVALFLLNVQRNLGAWCIYCCIADSAMLLVAIAAAYRVKNKWSLPAGSPQRWLAAGSMGLALALPIALGVLKKPVIPAPIAEELQKTPKGQVTVIDFVDFECPWCRAMNESLEPLLTANASRLHVVRKQVPLRMHPHALDAARAACCGEALGKGDAMASALFKAEDLSPAGCEKIAGSLGLDIATYRDCLASPATEARIRSDSDMFRASKGHGLPTVWIGEQKLEGAQDKDVLEHAMRDALARAGS